MPTKIEWTDETWQIVTGCDVLSPGCTNCYAMRLAGTRLKHHKTRKGLTTMTKTGPVWNGEVRFNEELLDQPLRWRRPRMIFVAAHGDLFYERVPDEVIDKVFAVAALCPQHTFQILTKRAARMRDYIQSVDPAALNEINGQQLTPELKWPLQNVWLGVSVEDQMRADERRDALIDLAEQGWLTWVSYEPALGPVNWNGWEFLRWMVAGAESRQNKTARPALRDWFREARDHCQAAGVPFFLKQRVIDGRMVKEPGLDGQQWLQFPVLRP